MSEMDLVMLQHLKDAELTRANRQRLAANRNLLYWYENLYRLQLSAVANINKPGILEIGSGASPLRNFRSDVITSDVLELDYLDHVFDCHEIDRLDAIPDSSLDIITLTNVLHHLRQPLLFLEKAASKLKKGGHVVITEPYFSLCSLPIYKLLHHEPSDFSIKQPVLERIEGPLSSANMAIPYLIFFSDRGWSDKLRDYYDFDVDSISYYTAISYMATGGISRRLPLLPPRIYRAFFRVDNWLAGKFPRIFSSFFVLKLQKK